MSVITSVCLSDVHISTTTPSRDIPIFSNRKVIIVDVFSCCVFPIMSQVTASSTTPAVSIVLSWP